MGGQRGLEGLARAPLPAGGRPLPAWSAAAAPSAAGARPAAPAGETPGRWPAVRPWPGRRTRPSGRWWPCRWRRCAPVAAEHQRLIRPRGGRPDVPSTACAASTIDVDVDVAVTVARPPGSRKAPSPASLGAAPDELRHRPPPGTTGTARPSVERRRVAAAEASFSSSWSKVRQRRPAPPAGPGHRRRPASAACPRWLAQGSP